MLLRRPWLRGPTGGLISPRAAKAARTATTSPGTGVILGGVIVAPRASELILAVSVAMEQRLTAEQLAQTFAVYPSLSGSVTEAARKLMEFTD